MATIRPRRNKHGKITGYQAQVRRIGHPPQSKTFTRKADADTWGTVIESEMERGEFIDRSAADRKTLAEALTDYQVTVTIRKKGQKQERVQIAYWKRHRLAKASLSRLQARDFAEWRDAELGAGKSPNTVRNGLTLISHLFNHARKEWGLPVRNPIADLWRPRRPPGRKRRFKAGEEQRLFEVAPQVHPLLSAAVIVLTETAMRRADLCSMKKVHLDLARRVCHLPDSKNGLPRDVPLSRCAIEALSSLPARLDGRIWPWVNPDGLTHLFTAACKLAKLEDFHLHDLRHEATSRLANVYEVHQLAKIRGDKTLNQLMEYYHPTADELVELLDRSTLSAPAPRANG